MPSANPVPGPPIGRRERNKRDKLDRITRAAGDLFREQGFEATTGRQICERAGIATGTLFLYVRDKRELLFLIFEPLARAAFARLPRGLRDRESVLEGLMHLFGTFIRIYGRDPRLAKLFLQELFFRHDQNEAMRALNGELSARVARIIADGVERAELRSDVPLPALGQAVAAHYLLSLQLWLGTGTATRAAALRGLRGALTLQIEGIAPDSSASAPLRGTPARRR